MNAKLCKRLRRQARDQSVGLPLRRTVIGHNVAYDKDGKRVLVERFENDTRSTRGIYRALKREHA